MTRRRDAQQGSRADECRPDVDSATNASPALSNARDIVNAASASPSALITAACRSCSACSHMSSFPLPCPVITHLFNNKFGALRIYNLHQSVKHQRASRNAPCWAICFASTACVNSCCEKGQDFAFDNTAINENKPSQTWNVR
jgi:hypothetical protein